MLFANGASRDTTTKSTVAEAEYAIMVPKILRGHHNRPMRNYRHQTFKITKHQTETSVID